MSIRKNIKADLKRTWQTTVQGGFIVSLTLFLTAFLFFPDISNLPEFSVRNEDIVRIEDVPWTEQKPIQPPPVRPVVPLIAQPDEIVDDSPFEMNSEIDLNRLPEQPAFSEDVNEEIPEFVAYEEEPQIIGGMSVLMGAIKYPEFARVTGIEGTVVVRVVVGKGGEVEDAIIIKSLGFGLDEEVLRVVKTLRFKPALQQGKPVRVPMAIPVRFSLKNNK